MLITMDELLKKVDEILDKYGIVENREAIKDDIYYDIIQEACLKMETTQSGFGTIEKGA